MARSDPQLNFRIPAELKVQLEGAAEVAGRSLNQELVQRLQESISRTEYRNLEAHALRLQDQNNELGLTLSQMQKEDVSVLRSQLEDALSTARALRDGAAGLQLFMDRFAEGLLKATARMDDDDVDDELKSLASMAYAMLRRDGLAILDGFIERATMTPGQEEEADRMRRQKALLRHAPPGKEPIEIPSFLNSASLERHYMFSGSGDTVEDAQPAASRARLEGTPIAIRGVLHTLQRDPESGELVPVPVPDRSKAKAAKKLLKDGPPAPIFTEADAEHARLVLRRKLGPAPTKKGKS